MWTPGVLGPIDWPARAVGQDTAVRVSAAPLSVSATRTQAGWTSAAKFVKACTKFLCRRGPERLVNRRPRKRIVLSSLLAKPSPKSCAEIPAPTTLLWKYQSLPTPQWGKTSSAIALLCSRPQLSPNCDWRAGAEGWAGDTTETVFGCEFSIRDIGLQLEVSLRDSLTAGKSI